MNIVEARKSGKPFKRKHWHPHGWRIVKNNNLFSLEKYPAANFAIEANTFSPEDIAADDWEVKED